MKLDNLFFLPLFALSLSVCPAGVPEMTAPSLSATLSADAGLRPMSTDRPDITESAYSVPAGFFQVEMSWFDYERESRSETLSWGQMNLKRGLTENMDLQVVFDVHQEIRQPGLRESGFGDVTVRLKRNLWGNDGGRSAFALMPYVTIPTGADLSADVWQGGLVAPFAWEVSERVAFGLMGQADLVHDDDSGGYDLEWLASATVGLGLTDRWGIFTEAVILAGEDTPCQLLSNSGVTYALTENCVLDAGIRFGLSGPAPDVGVFSGISFRF